MITQPVATESDVVCRWDRPEEVVVRTTRGQLGVSFGRGSSVRSGHSNTPNSIVRYVHVNRAVFIE